MREMEGGFTLIEILIVVAVVAVLSAVAFLNLPSTNYKYQLDGAAQQIVASARQAQSNAMSQLSGGEWGIRFSNATNTAPFYAIFNGSAYSATSSQGTYPLPAGIAYLSSTLASGGTLDVTFSPVSGASSVSTTITIYSLAQPLLTDSVSINSPGLVSIAGTP